MKVKIFIFLAMAIFLFGFVSSEIVVGDSHVKEDYSPNENIEGWVEISFVNHSSNITFEDSFGNSVSLAEFLGSNPDYSYVLNQTTERLDSDLQRIYFNNLSFSVSSSQGGFNYQMNWTNETNSSEIVLENISISNLQNIVANRIDTKKEDIENLTSQIESYDVFLKSRINSALGISELESTIEDAEDSYDSASSNEEYSEILQDVNDIEIPLIIYESETADNVFFISEEENVDLEFLKDIGGGNYDSSRESKYKENLIFWSQENLNPMITFKKISVVYSNKEEDVLSYFEISFNNPSEKAFFVIEDLDGLTFREDYGESSEQGYTYIDLSSLDEEEKIVFSTTENGGLDNTEMFISPSLSQINVTDVGSEVIDSEEESKVSKWILFGLIMIFLIILFIVAYIILKNWYDKKYENYLFKNKNQLYNLAVYITNAKKRGMKRGDIKSSLGKAGWSNEQIRYMMRKYAGKRTGLWYPFDKNKNQKVNPQQHKN